MKRKIAARLGLALCLSFNLAALSPGAAAVAPRQIAQTPVEVIAPEAEDGDTTLRPGYTLRFYHLHTGESIRITRNDGDSLPQNAGWFMRDFRRGETISMDPELFDLLGDIQQEVRRRHPKLSVQFQVVSSYRSPATNDSLRQAGGDQARYSLHMRGKAMDIKIPGVATRELRDIVTCLGAGGVGYYPTDGFVHVDTGRVRYWPSRTYVTALKCDTQRGDTVAGARLKNQPKG